MKIKSKKVEDNYLRRSLIGKYASLSGNKVIFEVQMKIKAKTKEAMEMMFI